jgi:hypothetical protein
VRLVSNGQIFDRYKLEIQISLKVSTGIDGASIGNHLGSLSMRAGVKRDKTSGEKKIRAARTCSCAPRLDRIARGSPDLKQPNQNHIL